LIIAGVETNVREAPILIIITTAPILIVLSKQKFQIGKVIHFTFIQMSVTPHICIAIGNHLPIGMNMIRVELTCRALMTFGLGILLFIIITIQTNQA
jgi:hypothetical protein